MSRLTLIDLLLAATIVPSTASAQSARTFSTIQWWHPLAATVSVAALFLIDDAVQQTVQEVRSDATDDLGDFGARFKEPEVFYVAAGGALALGLATQNARVTRTGFHILAAYGLSSVMLIGTKWVFGRSRPSSTPGDVTDFDWFGGGENTSFPSGSAVVVFSLATTVADAVDRTPVSILLYSGAVLNSWARLNADRHWLSDVALGALYGITAAKLVNGRWRVFGLTPPEIWIGREGASLGYQLTW